MGAPYIYIYTHTHIYIYIYDISHLRVNTNVRVTGIDNEETWVVEPVEHLLTYKNRRDLLRMFSNYTTTTHFYKEYEKKICKIS